MKSGRRWLRTARVAKAVYGEFIDSTHNTKARGQRDHPCHLPPFGGLAASAHYFAPRVLPSIVLPQMLS
jgi:hypothetical protein